MGKKRNRIYQREKRVFHGDYLDVYCYPVFKKANSRGKKARMTSAAQKKLNQKMAEEKLVHLLHTNFTQNDIEIGLGFRTENMPESYQECLRLLQNYLRRIKRARNKLGLAELKYIAVIEKGKRSGRYHIHMTMSGGMDRDEIERIWGLGYANARRLQFTQSGLRGLAKYKVKKPQSREAELEGMHKRWLQSKNLKKPTEKKRDGFISRRTVRGIRRGEVTEQEIERLYSGYRIAEWEPFYNDVNGGEYLVIRLYKKDEPYRGKEKKHRGERRTE